MIQGRGYEGARHENQHGCQRAIEGIARETPARTIVKAHGEAGAGDGAISRKSEGLARVYWQLVGADVAAEPARTNVKKIPAGLELKFGGGDVAPSKNTNGALLVVPVELVCPVGHAAVGVDAAESSPGQHLEVLRLCLRLQRA